MDTGAADKRKQDGVARREYILTDYNRSSVTQACYAKRIGMSPCRLSQILIKAKKERCAK